MKFIKIDIEEKDLGKRLDKTIKEHCSDISRNRIINLIKNNNVKLENKVVTDPAYIIKKLYKVLINIKSIQIKANKKKIDLEVLFEDEHIIILNKSPGILTHSTNNNQNLSMVDLLKENGISLSKSLDSQRDGVVHRLDKDTSGLIVFAKSNLSYKNLTKKFSNREVTKIYNAICWGIPLPIVGTINKPIVNYINRKKASFQKRGKEAITKYQVKKNFNNMFSLVECKILTGRTHQIRVHMQSLSCPLVGDQLYSRGRNLPKDLSNKLSNLIKYFNRQALHSKRISFKHPITDLMINFVSETPKDMLELEKALFEELGIIW